MCIINIEDGYELNAFPIFTLLSYCLKRDSFCCFYFQQFARGGKESFGAHEQKKVASKSFDKRREQKEMG
jgi:hypothetical protein